MSHHFPQQIIGFHSCDREVGLKILNGQEELIASDNTWDWLGGGVYFWEQNPGRALEYAENSAIGNQYNKISIKTPFVLGAYITLGNCLNLLDSRAIENIEEAYRYLESIYSIAGKEMPKNKGAKRELDCAVIRAVHQTAKARKREVFDTVRCAFVEGDRIYEGSNFYKQLHIEISVINPKMIKGYFLPKPIKTYNPYLDKEFERNIRP